MWLWFLSALLCHLVPKLNDVMKLLQVFKKLIRRNLDSEPKLFLSISSGNEIYGTLCISYQSFAKHLSVKSLYYCDLYGWSNYCKDKLSADHYQSVIRYHQQCPFVNVQILFWRIRSTQNSLVLHHLNFLYSDSNSLHNF